MSSVAHTFLASLRVLTLVSTLAIAITGCQIKAFKDAAVMAEKTDDTIVVGPSVLPALLFFSTQGTEDFGTVALGGFNPLPLIIANIGESTATELDRSFIGTDYSLVGGTWPGTGGTCTDKLEKTKTCIIVVKFTPSIAGTRTGSISITYNNSLATAELTKSFTGIGTGGSILSISDAATYNYASTTVGFSANHTFVVTNTGLGSASAMSGAAFSGSNFIFVGGAYPGTGGNCGATLAAAATCNVVVRFVPQSAGAKSDTLTLNYNNGSGLTTATRALTGTGLTPAFLAIGSNTFTNTTVGSTSSTVTFTVTNSGQTTGVVTSKTLTTGTQFAITGGTCSNGATVAPAATCTITATFSPTSAGAKTDTITLNYDDGIAAQSDTENISGNGLTPAAFSIAANTFSDTTVGATSGVVTFTLTNTGGSSGTISAVPFLTTATQFTVTGGTCSNGASVAAAGTCTITATFSPTSAGAKTDTINVTYHNGAAAGQSATRAISGNGLTPAVLAISSEVFADTTVGTTSSTVTFTITNSGGSTATVSSKSLTTGTQFAITGGTCANAATVIAGGTCTITATFSPTSAGAKTDTITLNYNNGASAQSDTENISGNGIAPALLAIDSQSFADTTVGATSSTVTFTVTNSGSSTATISSKSLTTGTQFAITGGTCANAATVAPAATCTITATFSPTSAGAKTDTITLNYNNGASAQSDTENISGNGIGPGVLTIAANTFTNTTAGLTSSTVTFTATNSGGSTVTLTSKSLTTGTQFAITGGTCANAATVIAGGTCTITVTFSPTTAGTKTDTINLDYNDGAAAQSATHAISALGLTPALLAISSETFTDTPTSSSSSGVTFTVTNSGESTATISSKTLTTGTQFSITGGTCSNAATVAPAATCTIVVVFSPTSTGTKTDTINLNYNDAVAAQSATRAISALGILPNPILASVTISNTSPTNSTTYNLTYGAVTNTYSDYCILENSTTVGSCVWTAGALPATFAVSATENAKVLSVWIKNIEGTVSTRVDSNSVTLDTTAPQLASVAISNSSPTTTQTYGLTYGAVTGTYATYCILENDTTVGNCAWTAGTVPASYSVTAVNNAKVLSVWLKDSAGNVGTRDDTGSVTLDTTATVPTGWLLSSPANGITSADSTPIISATAVENGTIQVYSDSGCSAAFAASTAVTAGNSFNRTASVTGDGAKVFYYIFTDSLSNASACTNTAQSYTYQAKPIIQLSRTYFSAKETGSYVGQSVRVSRDIGGIANSITVYFAEVTARTGTHFTAGSTTVTFTASDSDTYQDVAIGTLAIANRAGTRDEDRYFTARLGTADANSTLGSNTLAQVNIMDTDDAVREYFFPHTLFSVNDTAGTLTLHVQRMTTGSAANVDIAFVDGSAVAGSDYTGSTLTASFGAGDDEASVSVPIAGVSSNKSFFAKIVRTSTVNVRANSIAKIRILDAGESNTCSTAGSNYNSGGGAGSAGDPYLICTVTQFNDIRNSVSSSYKLMADIDLAQGVNPIKQTTTGFTGNFNGNERNIYRFKYAAGSGIYNGLFGVTTAPTSGATEIKNLNLLYSEATSTTGGWVGLMIGANGATLGYPAILKNLHASGYVSNGATISGAIVGYSGDKFGTGGVLTNQNLLGSAYITGNQNCGGVIGAFGSDQTNTVVTINKLFSTSNLVCSGVQTGGVAGSMQWLGASTTSTPSVSDLENRGRVYLTATSCGGYAGAAGVIAVFNTYWTTTLSNFVNTGWVQGPGDTGGIIGDVQSGSVTISNATNWGGVTLTSGSTEPGYGGIVGTITAVANKSYTITSSTNYGTILGYEHVGGILGYGNASTLAGVSIAVQSNTNASSSTVTSSLTSANGAGGIVGGIDVQSGSSGAVIDISSNTNNATVNGGYNAAGVVATLGVSGVGTGHTFTVSSNTNTGTITGKRAGGIIAVQSALVAGFGTNTISNNNNSGSVTGNGTSGYAGGIIGVFSARNNAGNTMASNTNSGAVDATDGYAAGILSSYSNALTSYAPLAISSSSNSGTITQAGTFAAGGILGYANLGITGTAITLTSVTNTGAVSGASSIGGIAGNLTASAATAGSTATITKAYNTGAITGTGNAVGGIVGIGTPYTVAGSAVTVTKSNNAGYVKGNAFVGGIMGSAAPSNSAAISIQNSMSSGTLEATNGAGGALGGIVGRCVIASSATITFQYSYSRSTYVYASSTSVGGVCGTTSGAPTYTASYWLKEAAINNAIADDTRQKTLAWMQTQGNFSGWTFGADNTSPWKMLTYPQPWDVP